MGTNSHKKERVNRGKTNIGKNANAKTNHLTTGERPQAGKAGKKKEKKRTRNLSGLSRGDSILCRRGKTASGKKKRKSRENSATGGFYPKSVWGTRAKRARKKKSKKVSAKIQRGGQSRKKNSGYGRAEFEPATGGTCT